jgi:hypothetical protein
VPSCPDRSIDGDATKRANLAIIVRKSIPYTVIPSGLPGNRYHRPPPPIWPGESRPEWEEYIKHAPEEMPPIQFEMDEWNEALNSLKKRKVPGKSGITNKMLVALPPILTELLMELCNLCIHVKHIPAAWKRITQSLLHKGGDDTLLNNYWAISLGETMLKLMDKAVTRRATRFINKHALISRIQFGFQEGRTVQQALLILDQVIDHAIRNKENCTYLYWTSGKPFRVWHGECYWHDYVP